MCLTSSAASLLGSTPHRESESKNEDGSRDERDTNFALFHIFDDCSTEGESRGNNGKNESQLGCAFLIHAALKNGTHVAQGEKICRRAGKPAALISLKATAAFSAEVAVMLFVLEPIPWAVRFLNATSHSKRRVNQFPHSR